MPWIYLFYDYCNMCFEYLKCTNLTLVMFLQLLSEKQFCPLVCVLKCPPVLKYGHTVHVCTIVTDVLRN